jgi:KipI family sensor histidine kinase inhibitor
VRLLPYGAGAVLVRPDAPGDAASVAAWLRPRLHALDVVPAAETVLVDGASVAQVRAALAGWSPSEGTRPGPLVEVPVVYDGPDLGAVAAAWGVAPGAVGGVLAEVELVAAFCGFAPGFAYLAGLPVSHHVPRLDTPRTRVEPGSVAIGGGWCGVYPTASPGGWRIVGRTEVVLWDVSRPEPALLAPGTRVRFVAAG